MSYHNKQKKNNNKETKQYFKTPLCLYIYMSEWTNVKLKTPICVPYLNKIFNILPLTHWVASQLLRYAQL